MLAWVERRHQLSSRNSQRETMPPNRIVSRDEWLTARKEFLAKENELTRLRDQLSAERDALRRPVGILKNVRPRPTRSWASFPRKKST